MRPGDGFDEAVRALIAGLEASGAEFMLIGGAAVIARGVSRDTDDVDATVAGDSVDISSLIETLGRVGVEPRIEDAVAFALERQVLLLVHRATDVTMDVSFAWLPFERGALARADRLAVAGTEAPVAQVDDLIIYKAVAWRDRDRADIERLLRQHGAEIDRERILAELAEFFEVLEVPERLEEVERLLRDPLTTS